MSNMFSFLAPLLGTGKEDALSRSSFVATNPTPGTGIVTSDDTVAFSAILGIMNVFNSSATNGTEPYVIVPTWLKLFGGAANTNGVQYNLAFHLDNGGTRYSSGGSAITEVELIQSGEPDYTAPTSKATIHFGDLTLAAATDSNLVCNLMISKAVLVADDYFEIYWGDAPGMGGRDGTVHRGPGCFTIPPMWIRPGANLSIHDWVPSQTVSADFEFEFFYLEKPNANQTA